MSEPPQMPGKTAPRASRTQAGANNTDSKLLSADPPAAASSSSTRPEAFLCTFCWRPQASDCSGIPRKARVVGSRARLACEVCYNALLDLAVCWVCGEVVFREEECVSLGWCFWHKACYGCLMCGDRRVVQGVMLKDLFGYSDGDENMSGAGAAYDKEIDEIPLCKRCAGEVEDDRSKDARMIPMALERMDRCDGGLSRRRWEARRGRNTFSSHGDHALAEREEGLDTPSPIYVSIHDPIGGPSFQTGKAKPIPRWMQCLPDQRRTMREILERPEGPVPPPFPIPPQVVSKTQPLSQTDQIGPVVPRPPLPDLKEDDAEEDQLRLARSTSTPRSSTASAPTTVIPERPFKPFQMSRPFTLIDEEPIRRPSSNSKTEFCRDSRQACSCSMQQGVPRAATCSILMERQDRSSDIVEISEQHDQAARQPPSTRPSTVSGLLITTTTSTRHAMGKPRSSTGAGAVKHVGNWSSAAALEHSDAAQTWTPDEEHWRRRGSEETSRGDEPR